MTAARTISAQLDATADGIKAAWLPLRGARLLITGGSGFFGNWLLSAIHMLNGQYQLGLRATVVTRDPTRLCRRLPFLTQDKSFAILQGDVRTLNVPQDPHDVLIHGATTSAHETFNGASSLDKFDLLVDGTRNMMRMAKAIGYTKAAFLSSGVAYGPVAHGGALRESDLETPSPITAQTGLAHGKRAAEFIFAETCNELGIDGKIGRCFSFVGAGLPHDIHYAIGNLVASAMANDDIIIHSDGSAVRSYMDMRDFVIWLGLMLGQKTDNRLYNIGSPEFISIRDLAEQVVRILGSQSSIIIKGNTDHTTGNQARSFYVPCVKQFQADYKPPTLISLDRAIADYAMSLEQIKAEEMHPELRLVS